MMTVLLWYLVISIAGWLSFPISYRLLQGLADRGYTFTRTLGLLVWGYLFWLLASLGILNNDVGGILFALLALVGLSGLALRGTQPEDLVTWLRKQRAVVLSVEVIFLIGFLGMAFVRSANPEILGTEKPMELAFINAILRSPQFPPHDPWLSGYAISYYYFGYVLVAMLAKITGTAGSVAFNLGVTSVFALSACGAYGVVYNLLEARASRISRRAGAPRTGSLFAALLGPVFTLLSGNLEGILEVLHARGVFWISGQGGELASPFWKWLDLRDLASPPAQPFSWMPSRYLWWWRASRVVQDYDFAGVWKEVIDEFPAFSYLLADLHPHVLAMPFAFLAMALALNLYLGGSQGRLDWFRFRVKIRTLAWAVVLLLLAGIVLIVLGTYSQNLRQAFVGLFAFAVGGLGFLWIPGRARLQGLRLFIADDSGDQEFGVRLAIAAPAFFLAALGLGGLSFLNTWDFPFYVTLFAGVYAIRQVKTARLNWLGGLGEFFAMSVILIVVGILLYLPFYLGFSSQAGGILPNLIYPTRGAHLWIMFALFLLPMFLFLFFRSLRVPGQWRWQGFALAGGLILILWIISVLLAIAISLVPGVSDIYLNSLSASGLGALLSESIIRRFTNLGGWLTLFILLGIASNVLVNGLNRKKSRESGDKISGTLEVAPSQPSAPGSPSLAPDLFAVLLILLGALLVLGPEFLYLRDLFGWRINTIFKFYYQAWLMWGVASAYVSVVLLYTLKQPWVSLYRLVLVLLLSMGLTYTVLGISNKTNGFKPSQGFTLDGTAHLVRQDPGEMEASTWLRQAPPGVVAEAVGGSYTIYARISTLSGQPTVLGWDFHENQWRGGGREIGSRQADIQSLYCTRDWDDAKIIIDQYQIRYIVVGNLERTTYTPEICPGGLNEAKFERSLPVAYQQGDVTIYLVP
jgi:uncharacterized membrane protein